MKKKMKQLGTLLFGFLLTALAALLGDHSGVVMAADAMSSLPDAGKTASGADGDGGSSFAGIATETVGRAEGDPEYYLSDVDKRIVRIRPMATPVDQISRYADTSSCKSFEVKYYSVGTREISCKTNAEIQKQASGASISLPVDDPNMFTLDDTIRVIGVKGVYNDKGVKYCAYAARVLTRICPLFMQ